MSPEHGDNGNQRENADHDNENHDEHAGGHEDHREHGDHDGHDHQSHHAHMAADFRRRFWISIVLTVPVLVLSPTIHAWLGLGDWLKFPYSGLVQWALATAIFFYGGRPFLKGLWDEMSDLQPGMMTLIGLAVTVAWGYSSAVAWGVPGKVFFWELATLIDVMLLGHWIEMRSVMGASRALESLAELMPNTAHKLTDADRTEDVPVSELQAGDRVLVKPGEKIPSDGEIAEGHTSVNEAMVTGESTPVEKTEGEKVIGGSVNGDASIKVEIQKTGEETYLSQVIEMVRKAQQSRSKSQDLANRAAMWLTIVAITVGGGTLAAWLLLGSEFVYSLERSVTVMVITCPHALGLAVPLVVAVSTSLSAKNGLLIRDRTAFERARNVQAVLLDKTGTLTEGRFGVEEIVPLGDVGEDELLRTAAAMERNSEHPIARGIVEAAEDKELELPGVEGFEAIPGKGAQGTVDGRNIKVVSPGYLQEQSIEAGNEKTEEAASKGMTVVFVLRDDEPIGAIGLADVIREESREAMDRLKRMGIQPMMITGDNRNVAQWVADELELEDFFAEVLPEDKAEKVKEVQSRGLVVAMAGDGVNDAPALTQADVGIAIGAGTDVAIESADVVLVHSDPRDVTMMMQLARATHRKMVQNLFWATGYNVVAIPLAAGVLAPVGIILPPAVGAAVMAVSTVIVAINARFLNVNRENEEHGSEDSD